MFNMQNFFENYNISLIKMANISDHISYQRT